MGNSGENLHQTFRTHKLLRSASFALRHLKNNKKNVHIILIGNSLARTHVYISVCVGVYVCYMCQARPPHEDSDIWAWLYDWANQFGSAIILCYLFAQAFHNDMWAAPCVVFKCGCQGLALFMVSSLSLSPAYSQTKQAPKTVSVKWFAKSSGERQKQYSMYDIVRAKFCFGI